jgi:hypothetical protein
MATEGQVKAQFGVTIEDSLAINEWVNTLPKEFLALFASASAIKMVAVEGRGQTARELLLESLGIWNKGQANGN